MSENGDEITYLNTDLDLLAPFDLRPLARALEAHGLQALHVDVYEDEWRACFEEGTHCLTLEDPEATSVALLDAIEALDAADRALWNGCTLKEFNVGYDCGSRPWAFNQGLTNETLRRIVAVGATLRWTLYPAVPDADDTEGPPMTDLPDAVNPPLRTLMGPGPSDIHPRVWAAMAAPTVGHLDPYFLRIMDEMQDMLRTVFRTENQLTLAVSGTGSAGMEACIVNLVEPGDKVLVCKNGVFGGRMADVADRVGAEVTNIERPFGEVFDPDDVATAVKQHSPKIVGIVHAETSTGARQPLEEISKIVHDAGALLLVDCVTSLAGCPVEIDAWDIDAAYSGTQKCLSCPPGLAPVTFSPRALEVIDNRKSKVASWYLDTTMIRNYWGSERSYHHTAPINANYGLHEALRLVLEEGLEARWARHARNHHALKSGLAALGIDYAVAESHRLPMLNAVRIPDGIDDGAVRSRLLNEFGIEIGAGLGPMKGKTWRIGLMGEASTRRNVLLFLAALEACLAEQGAKVEPGAGVAAANAFYARG